MTPRLTKRGRISLLHWNHCYDYATMSRPSPAERLRQRRKARADALRYVDKMQGRIVTRLHRMYIAGTLSMGELPQSRGTTTGQLVAMHLEAESENDR